MASERSRKPATSPKTGDLDLGRRIATRREELGLSRKELAEAVHLSYPYVAQIETGYRSPSAKHQVLLSKVLGLSLDELFGTDEELPRPPERLLARATRDTPVGSAAPDSGPWRTGPRVRRASLEEAVEHASQEIEALPATVRLEALSRLQLRIMQGVADEQARERR